MKGDVYRVVVQFSNESNIPLRNVTAKILYPKEAVPYPEKIYQKKVSKFPWPDHFVDEDKRIISFKYNFEITEAQVEFYSYFVADKYGVANFEYVIEWLSPDSLYYRTNSKGQEIILPDFIDYPSMNSTAIFDKTKDNKEIDSKYGKANTKQRFVFIYGLFFLTGSLVGVLISYFFLKKNFSIDDLIEHFKEENCRLRAEINEKTEKMGK